MRHKATPELTPDEKAEIITTLKDCYHTGVKERRNYWFGTVKRNGITYSFETWDQGKTFRFSQNITQSYPYPVLSEWV